MYNNICCNVPTTICCWQIKKSIRSTNYKINITKGDKQYGSNEKGSFLAFGYGPRICIGKILAYHDVIYSLVKLYQGFTFDVP